MRPDAKRTAGSPRFSPEPESERNPVESATRTGSWPVPCHSRSTRRHLAAKTDRLAPTIVLQTHPLISLGGPVFLTIALVLIVLWALGFFAFAVGGGLIHILLVLAIIAIIWHFITGRRTVV